MSAPPPAGTPRVRSCPTCGAPRVAEFRPFCSKRCSQIDLHRWFTGAYAIPVVDTGDVDEEDGPGRRDDDGA